MRLGGILMKIFYGSYGFDILSIFLMILSCILSLFNITSIIGLAIFIFAIYRAFSKKTYKRINELNRFTFIVNNILSKFNKKLPDTLHRLTFNNIPSFFNQIKYEVQYKITNFKKYKIVKCPKCKQKLRLPRGKGAIIVTCKSCSHKFNLKT